MNTPDYNSRVQILQFSLLKLTLSDSLRVKVEQFGSAPMCAAESDDEALSVLHDIARGFENETGASIASFCQQVGMHCLRADSTKVTLEALRATHAAHVDSNKIKI